MSCFRWRYKTWVQSSNRVSSGGVERRVNKRRQANKNARETGAFRRRDASERRLGLALCGTPRPGFSFRAQQSWDQHQPRILPAGARRGWCFVVHIERVHPLAYSLLIALRQHHHS